MMTILARFRFACVLLLLAPLSVHADEPSRDDGRIVASLRSADELIEDLRYVVVELAKEKKAWDDSVFPNIDVFLFGVDKEQPVGVDVMFDAEKGRQINFHVPISDKREFLSDNLNATDITTRPVPGESNLYSLGGLFEGFLRFTDGKGQPLFATITPKKSEVPANLPGPKAKLDTVLGEHDAAIRWSASEKTADSRQKGFAKLKENLLAAIEKRPDETKAAYELRRLAVEQQADRLARLLTNSAELTAGWRSDVEKKTFGGSSRMVGLPGTLVAKDIEAIGSEKSLFERVPATTGASLTARFMIPINEKYREEQTTLYATWLTAWHESIDEKEGLTDEQKAARKQVSEQAVKAMTEGLTLGWVDGFIEMNPGSNDLSTAVFGIRVHDSAAIIPILETLPKVEAGWTTELNTSEEHGVQIHKLNLKAKLPKSLKEFFGESGELLVGTGERVMWIAGGTEAETRLKAAIAASASTEGDPAPGDTVNLTMRARPALKFLTALLEDDDIAIVRSLNQSRLIKNSKPGEKNAKKEESERKVSRDALKNFKWEEKALDALAAGDDGVQLRIYKEQSALLGSLNVEIGVMRAIGNVVAKFTTEVLR